MNDRLNIAYIGGGSNGWGWRFIPELADESICAMCKLYDTDKTCALVNEVIGNNIHDRGNNRGDIVYLACDSPEEALRDADFVILSFDPGNLEELTAELTLPEKYGIYQTGGENTGPASVIRALKIMPLCAEYARLIESLCPQAWVINLCTPLAQCMRVMLNVFPGIKIIGADNDTSACRDLLAAMLCERLNVAGIKRRDIKTNIVGISGFSWIESAHADGTDIFPVFRSYAEKYAESGYEFRLNEYRLNPDSDGCKVKFDMFLRYGLIPAVNDRTAAAFCPPWYTRSPDVMNSWKFSPLTAAFKSKQLEDKTSRVKKYMNGEVLPRSMNMTEVPAMIRALTGGGNLIAPVSLPNRGQAANLPSGTIVTTNALISRQGVRPVTAGPLPEDILGLTMRHVFCRSAVVRAYEERDLDIAFNAFLNDPAVICSLSDATQLFKDMLSAVRTHLLYYIGE